MTANSNALTEAIDALAEKAHKCFDAPPLHSCHHYRLALAERIGECVTDAIETHRGWRARAVPQP